MTETLHQYGKNTKLTPVFIIARDIPDLWFQLLSETYTSGRQYTVEKGSTPTARKELDFVSAQITHPGTRPLEPDIPPGLGIPNPIEPGYAEKYLRYYITGHKEAGEHYTYGEDLSWQIEWVINYYKTHGHRTKHCYMTVGRPESLYLYDDAGGTTQCLRGIDTAIKYGRLHFSIHFRSWNLWSGLPANLACLQLVKEYMSESIGVGDGEMFVTCLKLGIAESCFDLARIRLGL